MRVNNTFRKIIDCFWRKHCRDSPCQTSSVVFQIFLRFFFLTRSLIDRCQIVTDTCKNNVSKFVWKPFKSPLSLRKWKCFGEASLFNLHHLYFNYHLLAQKLFTLWKILPYLQPSIIRVLSKRISLSLKKYICYLPAKVRSVLWKTVTSVLKIFKTSVTVFHHFSPWIIFESLNIVLPALNYDSLFVNFIQVVLAN